MTEEIWRPVVGYEDAYEVSNLGRVRSKERTVAIVGRWGLESRRYRSKVLRLAGVRSSIYLRVVLSQNGVLQTRTVHSLVAEAFLGPAPAGFECRHKNCDPKDNRADNLAYGTRSTNREDSRAAGTLAVGERIAQHKLKTSDVKLIRQSNESSNALAARFGVSAKQVRRVKNKENWRHV